MPSRLADEREQRRGLILGLTLAEILLLLLFLLLLTLAAELKDWQDRANTAEEQLKPLQEALYSGGAVDIAGVQQLVERFKRLQDVEAEAKTLKEKNSELTEQSQLFKSLGLDTSQTLRSVASAVKQASEIDPNDPPALLKRAVEVLNILGKDTQPGEVKPFSEVVDDLSRKLATTEAEREKYRLDVLNLMHRSGNGLTYPSCWKTPTGQTEYIFDITFGDRGIRVRDATPARAKDSAWELVGSFGRDAEIDERNFVTATRKLADWATSQNCKFYTRNRDETGPSNKTRYKYLQRIVEQNFYPYYAPAPNAAPRRPASAAMTTTAAPGPPVEARPE
ncbi:hypothetical protein LQG66_28425 [Bradyrhizobium ontarionense]|uniref:OmpA-like domain-containing protein n=1 Tax=Bradyrhizobium ontarionense TaxID=2898149 RepID=A0ABY3R895_9BRAD|nr:hypothetical protein [Bradyrhizobium sp. A19]UFZ03135.1 hypothetical protein LQG66_28425 [Bradyrhizobium sp. A19]